MLILFSARHQEIKAHGFPDLYQRFSTVRWSALAILGVFWSVLVIFFAEKPYMSLIIAFYLITIVIVMVVTHALKKNRHS